MGTRSKRTTPRPITVPTVISTVVIVLSDRELNSVGFGISVMVDVANVDVRTMEGSKEVGAVDLIAGVDVNLYGTRG